MPAGPVLPEYTDERLQREAAESSEGVALRARQLLRVPTEARQAIASEAHALNTHTMRTSNGMIEEKSLSSWNVVYDRVIASYLDGLPFTSPVARSIDPRS